MAKSEEIGELKELLIRLDSKLGGMESKIGQAKVLNGGFDRLEKQVEEIRSLQAAFNADFKSHVINDERMETKIDRLYDPEEGIYVKVAKTETMLAGITESVQQLSRTDTKLNETLVAVKDKTEEASRDLGSLKKITGGDDHKELAKAVKTTKNFWRFALWAGAGLLTAFAKFAWDLFVG